MDDSLEKLKKVKADFLADYKALSDWRERKLIWGDFYDGEQWTAEEIRVLNDRKQPIVTINRIKPKVDTIIGTILEIPTDTKAYPKGDRENEAENISQKFRQIEEDSNFDMQESEVAKDQQIDGIGWYECYKVFDGLNAKRIIERIDNDLVVPDRHSRRADQRDAKRVHKQAWKDLEDAKALFPDAAEELEQAAKGIDSWTRFLSDRSDRIRPDQYRESGGSRSADEVMGLKEFAQDYPDFVDPSQRRVRLVTTYYRTTEIKKFLAFAGKVQEITKSSESDIKKAKESFPNAQEWTQVEYKLNSVTFAWNVVLEEKFDIRSMDPEAMFPLTMAKGYITRRPDMRVPYGSVKQMVDPQKEVNKRRSKALHLASVNQIWHEKGSFDDPAKARLEAARPDGWVEYNPNFKTDRVTNLEMSNTHFQMLQEAKQEIDSAGINRELEGRTSAQSAKQFKMQLREGLKSNRELIDNLYDARKRVFSYWLPEIVFEINEEIKAQNEILASQGVPPEQLPKPIEKMDVVVEEAPESINEEQETFQELVALAQGGLQIPPMVLLKASPLPPKTKQEILDDMQNGLEAQVKGLMQQNQVLQAQLKQVIGQKQ
jgi:hypothetical protein